MTFTILTPPAVEPVSVAEVKARLRLDTDAEDAILGSLITAARARVEALIGRALITQRVQELRDGFPPNGQIVLALAPVSEVVHIRTIAADGTPALVDAALHLLDGDRVPARIARLSGGWPTPQRSVSGVEIVYDAGYGAEPGDVPAALREAILALVADHFEHRTPAERSAETTLPLSVQGWLAPFVRVRL